MTRRKLLQKTLEGFGIATVAIVANLKAQPQTPINQGESWWADAFPQWPHPGRPSIINSPFGQCWRSSHKRIVNFTLAPYSDFIEGRLPPQYLSRLADVVWNSQNPPEVF